MCQEIKRIVMQGVREYAEKMPVELVTKNGRLCLSALNQGGYDGTDIDLVDVLAWLKANRPELLT